MFSRICIPGFSPVKPCFLRPVVHPQPLLPLGRFFHRRARGQRGRRPRSSEPHAPEQHQQAASSTRSTANICGPPAPPASQMIDSSFQPLSVHSRS